MLRAQLELAQQAGGSADEHSGRGAVFVIGVIGQGNDFPNADQGLPVDRLRTQRQNGRAINQRRRIIGRYIPEHLSRQY